MSYVNIFYGYFNRKNNTSQYIGVDGLAFGAIPKFKHQSYLLFK